MHASARSRAEEDHGACARGAHEIPHVAAHGLYALAPAPYSCYTCVSRPKVILNEGQTFKVGQTCGTEKSRYASGLPEPGLFYLIEFRGNLFEVMVAEYVKLLLFQYSKERQNILKNNKLPVMEMQLPPGNKILR